MYKILVVDDEHEIADLIELYLKNDNFEVVKCYDAKVALEFIKSDVFDLAILDIMMSDTSGFELCKCIRKKYPYPIIMLTAKDEAIDKITGLSLGADDYMTKPFHPLEMTARVKAQLRRYTHYNQNLSETTKNDIITHSGLLMNIKTHECILNEQRLSLTPTEFSILRILLERKGEVVSAEALFHAIWQDEFYTKNNNTITVHVRHLREKMMDTVDRPKYIKTVWGVGYQIEK